ncbi:GNAT family N-acetyltransferase [Cellulomonas citrea]|uniref:GNAT family N-acetyltransferase n=1 Tax=Cellulomonas citrea TaxID=1909423 RepID=UPI001F34A173|nr:GNAT family N-acetyltransferase [Cellulomonas citrea]
MHLRPARPDDADLLVDLVALAVAWSGRDAADHAQVLGDDHLVRYVEGWPRTGDRGTVAVDDEGCPLGGAWLRLLPASRPGYSYVADDVPELTLAVLPHGRGRGVGTRLLDACLTGDLPAVSLSVEDGNDRARGMYLRRGFVVVGREGGSDVMLRTAPGGPATAGSTATW